MCRCSANCSACVPVKSRNEMKPNVRDNQLFILMMTQGFCHNVCANIFTFSSRSLVQFKNSGINTRHTAAFPPVPWFLFNADTLLDANIDLWALPKACVLLCMILQSINMQINIRLASNMFSWLRDPVG